MAIFNVLEWNQVDDELLAWKFPAGSIPVGSQLIVAEGQEAVLLREGRFLGPFRPGRHTLDTRNVPLLQQLVNLPFGTSPFPAACWFVRRDTLVDIPWGTPDPVNLMDPTFGIAAPVRLRGNAVMRVLDICRFLRKLVGTRAEFGRADVIAYLRPALVQAVTQALGNVVSSGRNLLELPTASDAISADALARMNNAISDFGLGLDRLFVESISFPEDDEGIKRLRKALADRMQLGMLGSDYGTVRGLDVLQAAAENEGGGGVLGAGAALGAGLAGGQALGGLLGQSLGGTPPSLVPCSACRKGIQTGVAFCQWCGTAQGGTPQP